MKAKRTNSKARIELKEAVVRAELLCRSLERAQAEASKSNPLLAMVLVSRLDSAASLNRKLAQVASCLG